MTSRPRSSRLGRRFLGGNDDATQFTFHLKSGTKFHNGETVTSKSFKYGWERICNPETNPGSPSVISYHLPSSRATTRCSMALQPSSPA